jgi:hypothetical protein
VRRDLHGIDCELNVHVALNLAPPAMIDELLRRLGNDRVAVVFEPIDQWSD